jgi:hypothetical protein
MAKAKKSLWNKVPGLEEWKRPGYTIEQMNDDPITMLATRTGEDNEGGIVGRYTAEPGESPAQLLKRVKRLCEEDSRREPAPPEQPEQAAKLATALEWTTGESGELVAGPYTVSRSRAGEVWRAHYHDPAAAEPVYLGAGVEPEPLQQLCSEHKAGAGLEWHETAIDCWLGSDGPLTYRIESDGELWQSTVLGDEADDEEIGADDTPEEAMAQCQIHRGQRLLKCEEAAVERDTKPEKPARERGDWMIPVPLTEAEAAAKGQELGRITTALGRETLEIARANDDRKRRVRAAEDEIKRLNDEALPLAEQLEAGEEHRLVDCVKHKGDGEIWYTDPDTGEELHRHAVPRGEQQGLWGERPPPPDKPPSKGDKLLDEVDSAIQRALAEGTIEAVTAAGDAIDAAAEHLQKLQLEQPAPDPLPADRELTKADFTRQTSGDYLAGVSDGDHYRIAGSGDTPRDYTATFSDASGVRELPGDWLPGSYKRLKSAIAGCSADNRRRLRWPCSPKTNVQVSACNRYQVTLTDSGDRHHLEAWRAEAVGGQDEENVGLGEHGSLAEARAACQAHKDGEAAS